ncbi:alpha/beta hydrolase [Aestuariivirga sp.]|uniref:alpha/beta hydrolase n=1 Tax=Aestuariivirga sp. TaxID=2650926 RepID=UPI0039E3229C
MFAYRFLSADAQVLSKLSTRIFLNFLILMVCYAAPAKSEEAYHADVFFEYFLMNIYPNVPQHKVIVVGPGGYWQPNWSAATKQDATEKALQFCNEAAAQDFPELKDKACRVLVEDNDFKLKFVTVGGGLNDIAKGDDIPLKAGPSWKPAGKPRGIVLFELGCNWLQGVSGWQIAWADFYTSLGYLVFMPDSFAEQRPEEVCGTPKNRADDRTAIFKIRMAQARRSVATLRRQFPGLPIILQGHSEGGGVVQGLGTKVDGIIVTGAQCGFGNSFALNVAKKVPLLVIAGSDDPFAASAKTSKSFSAYCNNLIGNVKAETLSVAGHGHDVAPWWPGVSEALGKFLKANPVAISHNPEPSSERADDQSNDFLEYKTASPHKAWAQYGTTRAYAAGAATGADAAEYALFSCDNLLKVNPYTTPNRQHVCKILDIDSETFGR